MIYKQLSCQQDARVWLCLRLFFSVYGAGWGFKQWALSFPWDSCPNWWTGRSSFVDELITLAGGINIAQDVPRPYSYISPEQVIKRNPDIIILGHKGQEEGRDVVKHRLGWKKINAVKHNTIYDDINTDIYLRPGPRLVEGLEEIHKKIFSDEYKSY